jgi:hypothetical protein
MPSPSVAVMAASQEEINKSAMVNATNTWTVLLDLKHTRYRNMLVKEYLKLASTVSRPLIASCEPGPGSTHTSLLN